MASSSRERQHDGAALMMLEFKARALWGVAGIRPRSGRGPAARGSGGGAARRGGAGGPCGRAGGHIGARGQSASTPRRIAPRGGVVSVCWASGGAGGAPCAAAAGWHSPVLDGAPPLPHPEQTSHRSASVPSRPPMSGRPARWPTRARRCAPAPRHAHAAGAACACAAGRTAPCHGARPQLVDRPRPSSAASRRALEPRPAPAPWGPPSRSPGRLRLRGAGATPGCGTISRSSARPACAV
jgi:hypothetical protein